MSMEYRQSQHDLCEESISGRHVWREFAPEDPEWRRELARAEEMRDHSEWRRCAACGAFRFDDREIQ